jgi:glycosyltransferase involved in cell wall biosynthesis
LGGNITESSLKTTDGESQSPGGGQERISGLIKIFSLLLRLPLIILWGICFERKSSPVGDGDDILFISQYHWEKVWRRNQHVAKYLAGSRRIFYVTPFPLDHLTRFMERDLNLRGVWAEKQIYAISLPVLVGETKLPFIRWINSLYLMTVLKRMCKTVGISPKILWFSHPYAELITRFWRGVPVVYDVQDEYPAIPTAPKNVFDREIQLLGKADLVLTGTYSLYLKKRQYAGNIHFVPCGVDFLHFNNACDEKLEVPAEVDSIDGEKILGYFGAIGERIDWQLLGEIGSRHPDWAIVLIGGVSHVDPGVKKLDNIHILGKRDYRELPGYIKGFDVCLIPFKLNDLTRYIYPTKLLEYLSAGKPVISSPIPDVERFFSGIVGIAGDVETFEREMEKIENGRERVEKGIEMARKASWESAVGQMEKLLSEALKSH